MTFIIGDTLTCSNITISEAQISNFGNYNNGSGINLSVKNISLFYNTNLLVWDNLTGFPHPCPPNMTISTWADLVLCTNISITEAQVSNIRKYANGSGINETLGNFSIFYNDNLFGWDNITDSSYPLACAVNQTITAFGDTLTCSLITVTSTMVTDGSLTGDDIRADVFDFRQFNDSLALDETTNITGAYNISINNTGSRLCFGGCNNAGIYWNGTALIIEVN